MIDGPISLEANQTPELLSNYTDAYGRAQCTVSTYRKYEDKVES